MAGDVQIYLSMGQYCAAANMAARKTAALLRCGPRTPASAAANRSERGWLERWPGRTRAVSRHGLTASRASAPSAGTNGGCRWRSLGLGAPTSAQHGASRDAPGSIRTGRRRFRRS